MPPGPARPGDSSGRPPSDSKPVKPFEDGRRALIFGIGAIILAYLIAPLGIVFGALALVIGMKALRRPIRRTMAGWGLGLGIAGVVFGLLFTAIQVYFWPETSAYTACESRANTHQSRDECREQFEKAVAEKIGIDPGLIQLP